MWLFLWAMEKHQRFRDFLSNVAKIWFQSIIGLENQKLLKTQTSAMTEKVFIRILQWKGILLVGKIYGHCLTIIKFKYNSMTTIQCKYISVLILCAGQLGGLIEYTSRLEGNNIGSNRTNLICTVINIVTNIGHCSHNKQ